MSDTATWRCPACGVAVEAERVVDDTFIPRVAEHRATHGEYPSGLLECPVCHGAGELEHGPTAYRGCVPDPEMGRSFVCRRCDGDGAVPADESWAA